MEDFSEQLEESSYSGNDPLLSCSWEGPLADDHSLKVNLVASNDIERLMLGAFNVIRKGQQKDKKKQLSIVKSARRSPKGFKLAELDREGCLKIIPTSVFPKFEKYQFLLFLPTVIAKCFNSGDFDQLRQILSPRASPDCVVDVCQFGKLDGIDNVVQYFESLLSYHPDNMCIPLGLHKTNASIGSRFAFKATSVRSIHEQLNLSATTKFRFDRNNYSDMLVCSGDSAVESGKVEASCLLASDVDLIIDAFGDLTISFDSQKKICSFGLNCYIQSVREA